MSGNPWKEIALPTVSVKARRASPEHRFNFFWAKDYADSYLFLLHLNQMPDNLPELPKPAGITVFFQENDGISRLVLKLGDKKNQDIFYTLCMDLMASTCTASTEEEALAVLVQRLERWRTFLKSGRRSLLTEQEQKGLIGELLFLKNYLLPAFPADSALKFWQGPYDAPQDFVLGDLAVEVKARTGISSPEIRISSAEQLHVKYGRLNLYVVTLARASKGMPGAFHLPVLVGEIREAIGTQNDQRDFFDDLLAQTGYMDISEYEEFVFVLNGQDAFAVREGFPRITPDMLPAGIGRVDYQIELEQCEAFRIELTHLIQEGADSE